MLLFINQLILQKPVLQPNASVHKSVEVSLVFSTEEGVRPAQRSDARRANHDARVSEQSHLLIFNSSSWRVCPLFQ